MGLLPRLVISRDKRLEPGSKSAGSALMWNALDLRLLRMRTCASASFSISDGQFSKKNPAIYTLNRFGMSIRDSARPLQ